MLGPIHPRALQAILRNAAFHKEPTLIFDDFTWDENFSRTLATVKGTGGNNLGTCSTQDVSQLLQFAQGLKQTRAINPNIAVCEQALRDFETMTRRFKRVNEMAELAPRDKVISLFTGNTLSASIA